MNTSTRIALSIAVFFLPLVFTWLTFGWESSLSKYVPWVLAAISVVAITWVSRYRRRSGRKE